MRALGAWLTVAVVVLIGCGDGVPRPAAMDPVSADEATALAHQIEAAFQPCDPDRLDQLFDSESFARRMINRAQLRPDEKRATLKELGRRDFSVARQLCLGFDEDTRFSLLRVRPIGATHRPLFRMLSRGALNYYDLELGKSRRDGGVRILDLYVYASGEELTTTVAELVEEGVRAERRGEHVVGITDINTAQRAGDWAEVRRLAAAMPARVRSTRAVRLIELQAAMQQESDDYLALIEAFERDFPDDPALDLSAIDGHFLRKDVDAALATIDRLDRRVGGDPYLAHMRAGAHLLSETPPHLREAERWARTAIDALPEVQEAWWNLATAQLQLGEFAAVVETLDGLHDRFGVTFDRDAMAATDVYRGFLASPEFEAWWARQ